MWICCGLLLLIIWAISAHQIRHERDEAVRAALVQNVNRVVAFEQYVARTLQAADMATLQIADQFVAGALAGSASDPTVIDGALSAAPMFLGISVADANGDVVATTLRTPWNHANVRDHPAFRAHLRDPGNQLYVSPPRRSRIFGEPVIWLTRRIERPDGTFAGVASINISPAKLTELFDGAAIGEEDVISVIGLDGFTRARRTGSERGWGEDLRGTLVMRMQERNPNVTYLGPSVIDGVERYFSHRRLDPYSLFVTYGVTRSSVLAGPARRAAVLLAIAALLTVLIAGSAWLLVRHLERQERLARALAEANARFREAQRIAQVGDWTYDARTGAVRWSPQLCVMYERAESDSELTLAEFESYLDSESKEAVDAAIAAAARSAAPQEYEVRVVLPSGAERYRLISAVPEFDPDGRLAGLRGTDQDVTAQRSVEQLQAKLVHLSRVEAMNAMASTLAHELNQPLAAASNYLAGTRRIVGRSAADLRALDEGIVFAQEQVRYAGSIIRRIREMVSGRSRPVERFSLPRIVDDAVALALCGSPRVTVHREFALDARTASGDPIQIQQVLVNLLRNAVEATRDQDRPELWVRSRLGSAETVEISVEDNGPGFGADGEAAFRPFDSGKSAGLGLGLSISRTIVERHRGRIRIGARDGGGAVVAFTLPVRRAPRRAEAA